MVGWESDALVKLAEWRSGSVSALPCERPGFGPQTRLREIIPANNCTMQGQNNWGNWGSPGVMKLWVAWEVLRWLMKFRELCSGGFHPKLVTPPYHGFLMWTLPKIVKIQNGTKCNAIRKSPSGSIIIGNMPLLIMRSPPTLNKCPFGPFGPLLLLVKLLSRCWKG